MLENKFEFHCPACRRNLGAPECLPELCPRCGTELSLLKSIFLDAEHSYLQGCDSIRSGDYASACNFFEHSYQLHHTEKSHRAIFFSRLIVKSE